MNNESLKKYLANELTPEERNAFELEMENDPFLTEAVEGLTIQQSNWDKAQINQLEKNIHTKIEQKITPHKGGKTISISFFRYAAAAGVIGILALVSWRLFITTKSLNEETIYASYFRPLTHPDGTVRGENNDTNDASAAVQAYEKEDYFAAVKYYEKLLKNDSANVKNNLFLGISYLATNQSQKAIEILSKLNSSNDFQYDIQWYLGLAYLKNKNIPKAQNILQQLIKENNYYKKSSAEILEKLGDKTALVR